MMNKQTNNVNSDEQKSDEQICSAFGSLSTEELSKYFPNAQCNTTDEQTKNVNSDEQRVMNRWAVLLDLRQQKSFKNIPQMHSVILHHLTHLTWILYFLKRAC